MNAASAPPVPLFADLVGQELASHLLAAALRSRRLAPAYLFAGPDGVGRRLAALRFLEGVVATKPAGAGQAAKEVLAGDARLRRLLAQGNHPDLLWVEPTFQHQGRLIPASQAAESGISRKVPPQLRLEQIRDVSRFLSRRPVESGRCMVVLESVESMAETAANALLKTLEEPGDGILVLISAAPDRLLATIRSRCQRIPFRPLTPEQVREVLGATASAEAQEASPDPPELLELAEGSPGALLDHRRQWQSLPEGLADRLLALGPDPLASLALARDLSEALEGEQQLWLLGWWQLAGWRRRQDPLRWRRLERLRAQLLGHGQPRLAWEVALLELASLPALSPGAARPSGT
ncbi:MAG: DNA polymerase III subunit delta' [Cyanobacteria bacterium]|nr:DNA polymerase III subunit delta' [Cyanobacteriota bacterium]